MSPKDVLVLIILTTTYLYAGRMEEARAADEEVLRIDPHFSLERFAATNPQKDPVIKERIFDSLRKAGLK